ncbi:hypothetical protein MA16_Dca020048 [Dendrobium catenatum]|uniref:Uncharacterized protein n=1 Tax=Dendrobium catenatum TaxID=906689 RepID=A0A2I0XJI8_9ASPA|nr:hypothetical protein MA16_Dca020048 [Dendrobium catenatum]
MGMDLSPFRVSPYKVIMIEEINEEEPEPEADQIHEVKDDVEFFEEDDDTVVIHRIQKIDTSPICVLRCALSQPVSTDD